MKKQIIAIVIGATSLLWSNDALSYIKHGSGMAQQNGGSTATAEAKGANCAPATAKLTLEFNDVSAFIEQGGSMWQNRQTNVAAYEIPKGSNLYAIYAGALWMGGTDVNGQLKLAALTFRSGNDFWPGPLTVQPGSGNFDPSGPVGDGAVRDFGEANIDPDQCLFYDKFYTIRKSEVKNYTQWWECQNGLLTEGCDDIPEPTEELLNRLYNWPAHGDIGLGQDYWLAPFYDNPDLVGADGVYNPDDGDIPWYDDILGRDDVTCGIDRRVTLFGDETHWWVFNDKGNIHTETSGDPIGMEIRAQAFAFATNDEVNRMTFYNYEMINRGTQTLFNTFFSQYIDADVGNYNDDYAGCDVSRGLGYMFNGDNFDEDDGGRLGYHDNPPAIGCDFFEGPYQDADGRDNVGPYFDSLTQTIIVPTVNDAIADTGIVYGGIGVGYSDGLVDNERFGMRRFTYYTNAAAYPYSDPGSAAEFYNFMSGSWANGSEMFYGGAGYVGSSGVTTTPSDYMFPGDSDPLQWGTQGTDMTAAFPNGWSEADTDGAGGSNPVGDRRFVQSAGPFTLKPGAINNITVGIVYGRATDGDLFASVEAMKRADTKAQALFDACFRILSPPDAPKLTIQELENELILMIENPATSNNYNEAYEEEDEINITDPNVDRFYRFEGYQIYQMVDDEASVSDILDASKARLVAQCDIENGIDRLINFEFDEQLGFSVPTEKVDGSDAGIQHTFKISEDEFAQGDRTLVNHKTYYYIAIAYAHNEFAEYDPTDPLLLEGQKIPYISSRLSFDGTAIKSVPAVPHNPTPEAGGTAQLIEYGSSPQIKRLDGYGNGNNALDLTDASKSTIINSGYMANPVYDYGAGPINVKVVDPLNVADGYFECIFHDYNASTSNGVDTASWTINRYDYEGGTIQETVTSDVTIGENNEQIIPEWGVSVQIKQRNYFLPEGASGGIEARATDLIGSEITYGDSSKQWIQWVEDNDAFYPTNWVRSGTYVPDSDNSDGSWDCLDPADPNYRDYLDPCNYGDQIGADPDKKFGKIFGGGVAPHRVTGFESSYMPMAYFNYPSPTSAKNASSISFLPSVDIVFTSDKSKWTRCPVIELGRNSGLNVGGAEPGEMRKSASVNKEGQPDATGTTGMGWFPGYAIDLESGARLYMAFGENSFLVSENGADMVWNPTDRFIDDAGSPLMGGMHPVYVYSYNNKTTNNFILGYDHPAYIPSQAENLATNTLYQDMLLVEAGNSTKKRHTYGSISWVAYPMLAAGQEVLSTDVSIKLRVNKEYKRFDADGNGSNDPHYSWNMDAIATETGSQDQLAEALKMINVVPNPYYAYSEYERSRLDNRVKITNLPEVCTVKIYTVNGKLVRTFKKDSPVTSVDWDLNNHKGIPIASGVYLIHVDVPEVGEVVLKFFGGVRQVDLQGI